MKAARLQLWLKSLALLVLLCIAGCARPTPGSSAGRMVVYFLDVGQGDSIVVVTPSGKVLIVDCGRVAAHSDEGTRVVLPFLRSQGIRSVDALVLTHPDSDHVGGAPAVLAAIPVGALIISPLPYTSSYYEQAKNAALTAGVPIRRVVRGNQLVFGDGVLVDVLNPPAIQPPGMKDADNNGSVVLNVHYGSTAVLLAGDAEHDAEYDMVIANQNVRADVLKLGHHGSHTSSSAGFLDAVRPAAAIVSAGVHNQFGHPHPAVLAQLRARSIPVFRTDHDGTITAISDGKVITLDTYLTHDAGRQYIPQQRAARHPISTSY